MLNSEKDIHIWAQDLAKSVNEGEKDDILEAKILGMREDLRAYIATHQPDERTRLLIFRYSLTATNIRRRMRSRKQYTQPFNYLYD